MLKYAFAEESRSMKRAKGFVVQFVLLSSDDVYSSYVCLQSLTLYMRKCGHMSTRFEKLVKLSGTNLTQSVYPMITYVQVSDLLYILLLSIPVQVIAWRTVFNVSLTHFCCCDGFW